MRVYDNISLKPYNTFGIDVKARRLVVIESGDEVPALDGDVLLLGGGSNMVFTKDYDGTVVTISHSVTQPPSHSGTLVTAWAGMIMDDLVRWTLDSGFYGLENLSAIPGTVGASAVQNVGAYGAEAKDFIESVEAYDLQERQFCIFSNADCQFAYRHSMFKEHLGRYLILRVIYRLSNEFVPNLSYKALEALPHNTAQQLRNAITDLRWSKLPRPEEHGSAGSFFKNPVVDEGIYTSIKAKYADMPDAHKTNDGYKLSAGWLIDRAGWKGKTMGRAGVWPNNALVLYNSGGCTGEEVVALAQAIVADVQTKFGITLEPEAIII
jgi:UDP-N-acetylmuramate dehydrogenase